jgi:hypothetical protein
MPRHRTSPELEERRDGLMLFGGLLLALALLAFGYYGLGLFPFSYPADTAAQK